jgi:Tol biopolymer transport system component
MRPLLSLLTALGVTTQVATAQVQTVVPKLILTRTDGGVSEVTAAPGSTRTYFYGGDTLWMHDRATGRTSRITNGDAWDIAISPSGDRLAFTRFTEDEKHFHVWMQPLDPRTGLANGPARRASMREGRHASFSADGKSVAFARVDSAGTSLMVMPVNGGSERVVGVAPPLIGDLQWAPDGKWIHYRTARGTRAVPGSATREQIPRTFERVPVAGGKRETLFVAGEALPLLSPDGQLIAVSGGSSAFERGLAAMGAIIETRDNTGKSLDLFALPQAGWSVNGWRDSRTLIVSRAVRQSGLHVLSIADGTTRRLLEDTLGVELSAWSPDGRRFAAYVNSGPHSTIIVANADGSGRRVYPLKTGLEKDQPVPTPPFSLLWSPDGRMLLFAGKRGRTVSVLDLTTGIDRVLHEGSSSPGFLTGGRWRADGRAVRYGELTAGPRHLTFREVTLDGQDRLLHTVSDTGNVWATFLTDTTMLVNRTRSVSLLSLHTGAERVLVSRGPVVLSGFVSDGSAIVMRGTTANDSLVRSGVDSNNVHNLEVITSTGASRLLNYSFRVPTNTRTAAVVFPDGKQFVAIGSNIAPPLTPFIYVAPLAGGPARKLITMPSANGVPHLAVSPDGKQLLYTSGRAIGEIAEVTLPPAPRR